MKIPTAEEMEMNDPFNCGDYQCMMIKFAELHVEAALKAAHGNMQLPDDDLNYTLDSYPLINIK